MISFCQYVFKSQFQNDSIQIVALSCRTLSAYAAWKFSTFVYFAFSAGQHLAGTFVYETFRVICFQNKIKCIVDLLISPTAWYTKPIPIIECNTNHSCSARAKRTLFLAFAPNSSTRGHSFKMVKCLFRINSLFNCFANRVVNCWNSLSSDIVNAASLTAFKMKLRSVDMSSFCAEARC